MERLAQARRDTMRRRRQDRSDDDEVVAAAVEPVRKGAGGADVGGEASGRDGASGARKRRREESEGEGDGGEGGDGAVAVGLTTGGDGARAPL